ncbi:MFS transporter [Cellulomonas sp. HZM]|uniref:MFS transporter n=1 Tax=Cellulomonas sp. HZM TaxID=1454010 RepID=UPI0005563987|nr:MFS transporter [Cellulomonas sp. HZM]
MTTLDARTAAAPTATTPAAPLTASHGRWLNGWDPEDAAQWESVGRRIARRNLAVSVFAEFLGFAVWAMWSIVVPKLSDAGFALTADQSFWLVAIPSLVGATMRLPYTFAVPVFGGRNWTIVSALLLLLPLGGLYLAVQDPSTSFGVLLGVAALAGLGGGNFASSMANISYFFPQREKGRALGFNAAGGNLGTAAVQLVVPIVVVTAAGLQLDRAALVVVPFVLLAALLAWRCMDNLSTARANPRVYAAALRERHTWVISLVYIGTFGSFIGFSGVFPTLLTRSFPGTTLSLAFLGALVGSLTRPLGGALADRVGGARLTLVSFGAMALGIVGAIVSLRESSLVGFFASFLWLFTFSGIGNGSVYRMIPSVFALLPERTAGTRAAVAAGCLGIAGAVGALGGFLIPRGFAISTNATGGIQAALVVMVGVYAVLAAVVWAVYARRGTAFGRARV